MNELVRKTNFELTAKKKKKGFTLIELIIVIAIIAILAAMAIPKFGQIRDNANQKADIATAKNIATIVAQTVANKPTDVTIGTVTALASGDNIVPKLDGTTTPKAIVAGSSPTFSYLVDTSGNITIYYTSHGEVYPNYNPS